VDVGVELRTGRQSPLDWPEGRVALLYVGDEEIPGDPLPVMNPPLGVQVLATLLRRHGVTAEVFDDRLQADPVAEIVAFGPDLVGLSYLSTASAEADRLAGRLRAAGLRTVAGGVHATVRADDLVAAGTYDCVVTGDGEGALLDLCGRLSRGEPLPARLDGISWGDLDALAPIDRFAVYAPVYGAPDRIPAVSLQIGRGCPMNCQFCELARDAGTYALPRAYGRRRPEAVVAELETYLDRWGATYVVLLDSIATLHQEALTAVIRHLVARGGVSLQLNAHVNKFGEAIAAEVATLDDVSVWFGFESGSDRMLKRLKKGHTAEAAWVAARRALDTGARLGVNLLIGLPGETDEDRALTEDFVSRLLDHDVDGRAILNPNIFNPLPGTPLYDDCLAGDLMVRPGDERVWSVEAIEASGGGPVRGIDYARVVEQYRTLQAMTERRARDHVGWAGVAD
jgi:anaerobic magnesium-protoporphyrin IX monomethyl ester cyclase